MLEVRGDFQTIEQWRKAWSKADGALKLASRAAAEECLQLTFERFRLETDPYGKRWKPKKRPDGRKTLSGKTSRLKGGWHIVRADRHGWIIAPAVDYALPHQKPGRNPATGRLYRPRRMMVPDAKRGFPREYREAMTEAAQDALTVTLGGGAGSTSVAAKLGLRRISLRSLARRLVAQTIGAASGG